MRWGGWGAGDRDPMDAMLDQDGAAFQADLNQLEQMRRIARQKDISVAASLVAADPALSPDEVRAAARSAFQTMLHAANIARPELARQVMTDPAWHALQSDGANADLQGQRLVYEDAIIDEVRIMSGQTSAGIGQVVVDVWVNGNQRIVDTHTGRPASASVEPVQWMERLTLRRDADPRNEVPRCPGCGAPLQLTPEGECAFCHVLPPGMPTRWLVETRARHGTREGLELESGMGVQNVAFVTTSSGGDAVTQAVPIAAPPAAAPAAVVPPEAQRALDAITARDPFFSPLEVVIEARQAFLLVEEARASANPLLCRAAVADACWAQLAQHIEEQRRQGVHTVHGSLEISHAEVIDAATSGGWEGVTVAIQILSTRCVVTLDGMRALQGDPRGTVSWRQEVALQRSATAHADPDRGLVNGTCPACGLALQVDPAGNCVHCRQHISDGSHGWVISALRDDQGEIFGAAPTAPPAAG